MKRIAVSIFCVIFLFAGCNQTKKPNTKQVSSMGDPSRASSAPTTTGISTPSVPLATTTTTPSNPLGTNTQTPPTNQAELVLTYLSPASKLAATKEEQTMVTIKISNHTVGKTFAIKLLIFRADDDDLWKYTTNPSLKDEQGAQVSWCTPSMVGPVYYDNCEFSTSLVVKPNSSRTLRYITTKDNIGGPFKLKTSTTKFDPAFEQPKSLQGFDSFSPVINSQSPNYYPKSNSQQDNTQVSIAGLNLQLGQELLFQRAQAQQQLENVESSFQQALQVYPGNVQALPNYNSLYSQLASYDSMIQQKQKQIDVARDNFKATVTGYPTDELLDVLAAAQCPNQEKLIIQYINSKIELYTQLKALVSN